MGVFLTPIEVSVMKISIRHATAGLLLLVSSTLLAQQPGPLRAGAAKVDISPTKEMFPIAQGPQTLGGVHDPIYARALVLDNGSSKVALISVDTAGMQNAADITKAVSDELKVPASHLSIVATHDHNTPTFGGGGPRKNYDPKPYLDLMLKGVVEAARQANASLQPARIGFGTGRAYINTNRDQKIGDSYKMGYAPEGPTDKTVAVMLVTDAAGKPFAVWSNYAVHGVVMFLSKTKDGKSEVTGDIGGATAHYVEDRMKGVIEVWTPGAAGDQNPLFMSTYNQDAPDVHDEGEAGWAILDVLSRRLGEEVVRVASSIQNTTGKAVLWGGDTTITCPGRKMEVTAPPPAATATQSPTAGFANGRMVDGDPQDIHLGLIMINDIALANVAGEVFNEISQKLKRESLFDRTAMVTLSGGSRGYIPSENAYLLPSAMAARNTLKPGCAEHSIVDAFVGLEKQYIPIWTAAR
jgi:neutral ceramidase